MSKRLHHHTFFSMVFDGISKAHRPQILSCFGLWVGGWLVYNSTSLPNLLIIFSKFSIQFCTRFGLPCTSIACISQCVCTHPINLVGIHLLHCAHKNECIKTHDAICDTFVPIV